MKNNFSVLSPKKDNGILRRGDIYYADLCGLEQSLGSEQTGRRPVLVIQNDVGNLHSPTTIVAILTTKIKRNLPTHVVIRDFAGLAQTSAVCLEQIKTIDKSRLENYCGNIGNKMMQEIEQAICISLGTKRDTNYELEIVKRNLDNEIEDILDYIESTNYNVAQGYKIYRMLRERRKQRKDVLVELSQLQALTEAFECEQMRKVYQNAISKMQQSSLSMVFPVALF